MNVVLNLPIKGKWFEMIAYGGKREEYRDCEHRQVQRAYLWAANDQWWGLTKPVAIFRNGYSMKSRAMVIDIVGFDLRGRDNVKHPEWGEPKCRRLHLVVKLGTVRKLGKYCEVKEWLGADQVKQIGNSIPVQTAKAIVKAIFSKEQVMDRECTMTSLRTSSAARAYAGELLIKRKKEGGAE